MPSVDSPASLSQRIRSSNNRPHTPESQSHGVDSFQKYSLRGSTERSSYFPQSSQHGPSKVQARRNVFDVFSICFIVAILITIFVIVAIFTMDKTISNVTTEPQSTITTTTTPSPEEIAPTNIEFHAAIEISSDELGQRLREVLSVHDDDSIVAPNGEVSRIIIIQFRFTSEGTVQHLGTLKNLMNNAPQIMPSFQLQYVLIFHRNGLLEQLCSSDFTNEYCEKVWLETCQTGHVGIKCDECLDNYYGPDCIECPACTEHGSCQDSANGDGTCLGEDGWTGTLCELPVGE